MDFKRTRYQQGSLTIEKRKTGPAVWVYRWREANAAGKYLRRKTVIGDKSELSTRTSAIKQLATLGLGNYNETPVTHCKMSIAQLVEHYRRIELAPNSGKTVRTMAVYEQQIRQYVLPKWGECEVGNVKTVAVEAWLKTLPIAPATKTKTRNVMSNLYQHARRYEFTATNPISLVRQSSKRLKEPEVLTPEEVCALLSELREPCRTIVHLIATTGMRRGELFGLKWGDIDLERGQLKIVRSIVDQAIGETKTRGSKRPLPLSVDVIAALCAWREATKYGRNEDWVFASPQSLGQFPYWPNSVMICHVQPAADRAGITKRIGWHTFRHTLATLLQSAGASVKVTQELLRHSSPIMTMGTYAQAVTGDKRDAQAIVAASSQSLKNSNPLHDKSANGPFWTHGSNLEL